MTPRARHHRRFLARAAAAILATAGVALAVAGCGGTSPATPGAASAQANAALAFSRCMRSHGVPSFPDPGAGVPSTADQRSPAFQAAQHACQRLNPKQLPPPAHPTSRQQEAALRLAECMRAHGYPHFPDPTGRLSGAGNGTVLGAFGVYFVLSPATGTHPHSPAFIHTATACGANPLGHR
jgi:hypothetical protein